MTGVQTCALPICGFALRESAERLKANNWVLEHAVITEFDPTEQAAPAEEAPAE